MGLLGKVKKYLPISSRSFHANEEWQNATLQIVQTRSTSTNDVVIQLTRQVSVLTDEITKLNQKTEDLCYRQRAIDTKQTLRFWSLYGSGASTLDDKRRFFRNLPHARGGLRLLQLALTKLLGDFADFCAEHDITHWWLIGGTLLGAERHTGFVPWDDDLDVGIMRDDLQRLIALIAADDRFEISVIWDHWAYCRQVRLYSTVPNIPGFIDLFIFDWCADTSNKSFEYSLQARRQFISDLESMQDELVDWCDDLMYMPINSRTGEKISAVYERQMTILRDKGIICDSKNSVGVIRAIDNIDEPNGFAWIADNEMMFPVTYLEFEGRNFPVPAQYMYFLEHSYKDIYDLPNDIGQHYEHVPHGDLERVDVRNAILAYIQKD